MLFLYYRSFGLSLLIAHYCGFNIMKPLPFYGTLDRFINGIDNELLQSLMHSQVKKLYEAGIIDASFIALDSTPIMANTSHNNPKSFALNILSQTNNFLPINDCTFIADKAYDVKEIYNTVKAVYNGDCAIPLNKRNTKNPEKFPSGHPLCEAGFAMNKDGKTYNNGRTRQKYCCPFKQSETSVCPCNHTNWNNGKKNKGCTKYVTLPDDYRLSIDRDCISFKKIYSLRTEIERYNSRFKQTGQERLWVHGMNAAQNLNTIAHISLLAAAYAAIVTHSSCSYRSLKSVKRIA